jgi:hypothetical protein
MGGPTVRAFAALLATAARGKKGTPADELSPFLQVTGRMIKGF